MNVWEAEAVVHKGHEISEVAGSSIKARHIYVITPYSGQAALLWTRSRGVALITDVEADSALEPMRRIRSPVTSREMRTGYCLLVLVQPRGMSIKDTAFGLHNSSMNGKLPIGRRPGQTT
jgi:hypothetical protein